MAATPLRSWALIGNDSLPYTHCKNWFSCSQWKEACDALTASVPKTTGMDLSGTNNIHSDTSQYDGRPHMSLGFRHSVSHVATINDVQPLSVLTLGSSQKTVSACDGAVATTMGDQPWLSRLGAVESTHVTTNGWHGLVGSSMDDRLIADFAAQSSSGIGMSCRVPDVLEWFVFFIRGFNNVDLWVYSSFRRFLSLLSLPCLLFLGLSSFLGGHF